MRSPCHFLSKSLCINHHPFSEVFRCITLVIYYSRIRPCGLVTTIPTLSYPLSSSQNAQLEESWTLTPHPPTRIIHSNVYILLFDKTPFLPRNSKPICKLHGNPVSSSVLETILRLFTISHELFFYNRIRLHFLFIYSRLRFHYNREFFPTRTSSVIHIFNPNTSSSYFNIHPIHPLVRKVNFSLYDKYLMDNLCNPNIILCYNSLWPILHQKLSSFF